MTRVLLVEDDAGLAFGLKNNLEIEGYAVDLAQTGTEALALIQSCAPALIILDLMLPEMDGYLVLRRIRSEGITTPVLVLTARGEEADKVLGFRLGADDYVTKPFGVLEVLARVGALLRRSGHAPPTADTSARVHRFGEVSIDEGTRLVSRAGRTVALTPLEFDLLIALMKRQGLVVTRQELLREVWGHDAGVVTRTVDTHIGELRKKLEDDPARPRHILTVRKIGYRLQR